jgi:ubiquinone biosynthesis monooxygenase Coq6
MPYARERYFENHKIMSAVDKLHKIYSTTAAPVVWARSTGLEILNELDTLKSAVMLSAGAKPSSTGAQLDVLDLVFHTNIGLYSSGAQQGAGWQWTMGTAADVISGAANAVKTAKAIGGALGNGAVGALRNALVTATEKRQ